MDEKLRMLQTKRFVIEDSYTKVTADGEPHEMMTLIAGLSGMLAAIIILIIVIFLIACKKDGRSNNCKNCATGIDSVHCAQRRIEKRDSELSDHSKRTSISTICKSESSLTPSPAPTPDLSEPITDLVLTEGNFGSNLNAAFVNSEFDLADGIRKGKKKMRWNEEVIVHQMGTDTVIDMTKR